MLRRWLANRWLRLALGLALSLLLLYLAFRPVSLAEVGRSLAGVDLGWAGLALLSVAANNLFKVLRWRDLLGPAGRQIGLWRLLLAFLSGQMLNTLVPARVGDLSRALAAGTPTSGRSYALGTVVLEKIIDLLWYALLFVLLLLLLPLPGWLGDSAWGVLAGALAIGAATFLLASRRAAFLRLVERLSLRLPERWRAPLLARLHRGLGSLEILRQPTDLARLAGWSTLVWLTALLTNQLTLWAFDLHLDWTAALLLLVGLMAGISIAVVPGRVGIFEWICVLALAVFGVGQAQALSYGLLLHGLVYLPTTLLGVLAFFWLSHRA